jgi:hypothetical protein
VDNARRKAPDVWCSVTLAPGTVLKLSLAAIGLLLLCDELAGFHERVGDIVAEQLRTASLLALGSVLLAVVILPPLAAFVWPWLLVLPRRITRMMILTLASACAEGA